MKNPPPRGEMVRAPKPSDGVGDALRNVFADAPALPSEWRGLLIQLDRARRQ